MTFDFFLINNFSLFLVRLIFCLVCLCLDLVSIIEINFHNYVPHATAIFIFFFRSIVVSAFSNGLEAAVVGKYGGEVQYMAINFSQTLLLHAAVRQMLEIKREIECP